jgi:predicted dehydrogenase
MRAMGRREFLKNAAVTAAAAAPAFSIGAQGANDRVVVGIMGVRVRGAHLAGFFLQHPDVEVRYIADPDTTLFDKTIRAVRGQHPRFDPRAVPEFRRILDDPEVDALVIAAPDHWHALATILACQAGKDVYVEKPVSHNLHVGRQLVEAAR